MNYCTLTARFFLLTIITIASAMDNYSTVITVEESMGDNSSAFSRCKKAIKTINIRAVKDHLAQAHHFTPAEREDLLKEAERTLANQRGLRQAGLIAAGFNSLAMGLEGYLFYNALNHRDDKDHTAEILLTENLTLIFAATTFYYIKKTISPSYSKAQEIYKLLKPQEQP